MKLLKIVRAYFKGDLVAVVRADDGKKYSYMKGENIDKRFILNSFSQVIKMNIN